MSESSCTIPLASGSSGDKGLFIHAVCGGGKPHLFQVDTGSVGILVPRSALGPDYQDYDPSKDITFGYLSSGRKYSGQWVELPVVLGVPDDPQGVSLDGLPTATVQVFAADAEIDPKTGTKSPWNGGMMGIGFSTRSPALNPFTNARYRGQALSAGYILRLDGIKLASLSR